MISISTVHQHISLFSVCYHMTLTNSKERLTNKTSSCVIQPTILEYNGSIFEYSAYKPTMRFLRDFDSIFPQLSSRQKAQLLVVPVIQKCEHDMVGLSKEVNDERDIKLELVKKKGGDMMTI